MSFKKKLNVYSELFESEKLYVQDLTIWSKEFGKALLGYQGFSLAKRVRFAEVAFANLDRILNLHKNIVRDMAMMNEKCRQNYIERVCALYGFEIGSRESCVVFRYNGGQKVYDEYNEMLEAMLKNRINYDKKFFKTTDDVILTEDNVRQFFMNLADEAREREKASGEFDFSKLPECLRGKKPFQRENEIQIHKNEQDIIHDPYFVIDGEELIEKNSSQKSAETASGTHKNFPDGNAVSLADSNINRNFEARGVNVSSPETCKEERKPHSNISNNENPHSSQIHSYSRDFPEASSQDTHIQQEKAFLFEQNSSKTSQSGQKNQNPEVQESLGIKKPKTVLQKIVRTFIPKRERKEVMNDKSSFSGSNVDSRDVNNSFSIDESLGKKLDRITIKSTYNESPQLSNTNEHNICSGVDTRSIFSFNSNIFMERNSQQSTPVSTSTNEELIGIFDPNKKTLLSTSDIKSGSRCQKERSEEKCDEKSCMDTKITPETSKKSLETREFSPLDMTYSIESENHSIVSSRKNDSKESNNLCSFSPRIKIHPDLFQQKKQEEKYSNESENMNSKRNSDIQNDQNLNSFENLQRNTKIHSREKLCPDEKYRIPDKKMQYEGMEPRNSVKSQTNINRSRIGYNSVSKESLFQNKNNLETNFVFQQDFSEKPNIDRTSIYDSRIVRSEIDMSRSSKLNLVISSNTHNKVCVFDSKNIKNQTDSTNHEFSKNSIQYTNSGQKTRNYVNRGHDYKGKNPQHKSNPLVAEKEQFTHSAEHMSRTSDVESFFSENNKNCERLPLDLIKKFLPTPRKFLYVFYFKDDDIYQDLAPGSPNEELVYSDLCYEVIYEKYLSQFAVYQAYAYSMPKVSFLFDYELDRDVDFKNFITEFLESRGNALGPKHFITRPTQKFVRYPLLFNSLKKVQESELVVYLQEHFTQETLKINEQLSLSDTAFANYKLFLFVRFNKKLSNVFPMCLYARHRKLIRVFRNMLVRTYTHVEPKSFTLLLFDHILVITDEFIDGKLLKYLVTDAPIYLPKIRVREDSYQLRGLEGYQECSVVQKGVKKEFGYLDNPLNFEQENERKDTNMHLARNIPQITENRYFRREFNENDPKWDYDQKIDSQKEVENDEHNLELQFFQKNQQANIKDTPQRNKDIKNDDQKISSPKNHKVLDEVARPKSPINDFSNEQGLVESRDNRFQNQDELSQANFNKTPIGDFSNEQGLVESRDNRFQNQDELSQANFNKTPIGDFSNEQGLVESRDNRFQEQDTHSQANLAQKPTEKSGEFFQSDKNYDFSQQNDQTKPLDPKSPNIQSINMDHKNSTDNSTNSTSEENQICRSPTLSTNEYDTFLTTKSYESTYNHIQSPRITFSTKLNDKIIDSREADIKKKVPYSDRIVKNIRDDIIPTINGTSDEPPQQSFRKTLGGESLDGKGDEQFQWLQSQFCCVLEEIDGPRKWFFYAETKGKVEDVGRSVKFAQDLTMAHQDEEIRLKKKLQLKSNTSEVFIAHEYTGSAQGYSEGLTSDFDKGRWEIFQQAQNFQNQSSQNIENSSFTSDKQMFKYDFHKNQQSSEFGSEKNETKKQMSENQKDLCFTKEKSTNFIDKKQAYENFEGLHSTNEFQNNSKGGFSQKEMFSACSENIYDRNRMLLEGRMKADFFTVFGSRGTANSRGYTVRNRFMPGFSHSMIREVIDRGSSKWNNRDTRENREKKQKELLEEERSKNMKKHIDSQKSQRYANFEEQNGDEKDFSKSCAETRNPDLERTKESIRIESDDSSNLKETPLEHSIVTERDSGSLRKSKNDVLCIEDKEGSINSKCTSFRRSKKPSSPSEPLSSKTPNFFGDCVNTDSINFRRNLEKFENSIKKNPRINAGFESKFTKKSIERPFSFEKEKMKQYLSKNCKNPDVDWATSKQNESHILSKKNEYDSTNSKENGNQVLPKRCQDSFARNGSLKTENSKLNSLIHKPLFGRKNEKDGFGRFREYLALIEGHDIVKPRSFDVEKDRRLKTVSNHADAQKNQNNLKMSKNTYDESKDEIKGSSLFRMSEAFSIDECSRCDLEGNERCSLGTHGYRKDTELPMTHQSKKESSVLHTNNTAKSQNENSLGATNSLQNQKHIDRSQSPQKEKIEDENPSRGFNSLQNNNITQNGNHTSGSGSTENKNILSRSESDRNVNCRGVSHTDGFNHRNDLGQLSKKRNAGDVLVFSSNTLSESMAIDMLESNVSFTIKNEEVYAHSDRNIDVNALFSTDMSYLYVVRNTGLFFCINNEHKLVYHKDVYQIQYLRNKELVFFIENKSLKFSTLNKDTTLLIPKVIDNEVGHYWYCKTATNEFLVLLKYNHTGESHVHVLRSFSNQHFTFETYFKFACGQDVMNIKLNDESLFLLGKDIILLELTTLTCTTLLNPLDSAMSLINLDCNIPVVLDFFKLGSNRFLVCCSNIVFTVNHLGVLEENSILIPFYDAPIEFRVFNDYLVVLKERAVVVYSLITGDVVRWLVVDNLRFLRCKTPFLLQDDDFIYELRMPTNKRL